MRFALFYFVCPPPVYSRSQIILVSIKKYCNIFKHGTLVLDVIKTIDKLIHTFIFTLNYFIQLHMIIYFKLPALISQLVD